MRFAVSLALFCFFGALPTASAIPTPAPPTLAQGLSSAPTVEGVALAVGAERVNLPAGSEAPKGLNTEDTAAAFGYETETFNSVTYVLDFRSESVTQGHAPLDSLVRAVSRPLPRRK